MLIERLVSQGYRHERLRNSLKKFCGRYRNLIVKDQRSILDIGTHSLLIPNSQGLSSVYLLIWTCSLDCKLISLMAEMTGVVHEADDAFSI